MSQHKQRRNPGRRAARRTARLAWADYREADLLDLRICDLGLQIAGTPLENRIERLYGELERRGLRFKPHLWLSNEWFSPDGIPGIAIPFYLAHPRLMRLEAKQMLEVEGGSEAACMRILRHEAGHAIDTAYRLHFKKTWRETFGPYSKAYPRHYRPRPNSKDFVLNLDAWYAQSHPAEDYAETFAVWLKPRSNWRETYQKWPRAYRKLEYVDGLMAEIQERSARVKSKLKVEPLSRIKLTLRQYFHAKRKHYGATWPDLYDRDLRRLFSDERRFARRPTAASFLREVRVDLRTLVAAWSGAHPYAVEQVLQDIIERCRELKLRMSLPRTETWNHAIGLLTVHTMKCLRSRHHEIPV